MADAYAAERLPTAASFASDFLTFQGIWPISFP